MAAAFPANVGTREARPTARCPRVLPRPKELEDVYQDAASHVLLAVCRHSWRAVAQHLETEVLTGVFPHRSLLYVMGVLTSNRTSYLWVPRHPRATLRLQVGVAGVGLVTEASRRCPGSDACSRPRTTPPAHRPRPARAVWGPP